jgi:hypothetical protein
MSLLMMSASILESAGTVQRTKFVLETPAELWNYFIGQDKANLHVVLCFSPVGEAPSGKLSVSGSVLMSA